MSLILVMKRKFKIMKLRCLLDKVSILTEEIDSHDQAIRMLNKKLHQTEIELSKVDRELQNLQ